MSVKSQYMWQGGEHWEAGEGAEDEDLVVYLIPPLPTYAAPPPPTEAPQPAPKPTNLHGASIPVKQVASRYEKALPNSAEPKVSSARLSRGPPPAVPPRTGHVAPGANAKLRSQPKRPRSGSFGDRPLAPAAARPVPPKSGVLPKNPIPASSTHDSIGRGHATSASIAALPYFESRNKFSSLPPLPADPPPPRPAKTQLDLSIKPALLVPVLPVGNGTSMPHREVGSTSAPSSASTSPRFSYQPVSAPPSASVKLGLPLPRADPRAGEAKTPGETSPSAITAPNRPSLRIDDSISDNRVIQELVITHEDYVKDLRLLRSVFQNPMKERSLVSADVHTIFFEGLEDIIRAEELLLKDMLGRKGLQPLNLANLIDSHMKGLQVYIPFCARQDQTLKLMTEQMTINPAFASFCDEVRKDPNCRGLSFDAFIIKPLQRMCKLPLLFREILKGISDTNSEEHRRVEATQSSFEKILEEINTSTGNAEKLIELERNLSKKYPQIESLRLQHRKLLLDGEIAWVVKQTKDQAKLRLGHFWLFDQLLIFCRSPKELDFVMPLNTVSISKNLPPVQNFSYVFELSDMTAQGLVIRKLCSSDKELYDTLLTKLS